MNELSYVNEQAIMVLHKNLQIQKQHFVLSQVKPLIAFIFINSFLISIAYGNMIPFKPDLFESYMDVS